MLKDQPADVYVYGSVSIETGYGSEVPLIIVITILQTEREREAEAGNERTHDLNSNQLSEEERDATRRRISS